MKRRLLFLSLCAILGTAGTVLYAHSPAPLSGGQETLNDLIPRCCDENDQICMRNSVKVFFGPRMPTTCY